MSRASASAVIGKVASKYAAQISVDELAGNLNCAVTRAISGQKFRKVLVFLCTWDWNEDGGFLEGSRRLEEVFSSCYNYITVRFDIPSSRLMTRIYTRRESVALGQLSDAWQKAIEDHQMGEEDLCVFSYRGETLATESTALYLA